MATEKWDIHVFDADGELDHIVSFPTLDGVTDYIDLQSESDFTRFDVRNTETFGESAKP